MIVLRMLALLALIAVPAFAAPDAAVPAPNPIPLPTRAMPVPADPKLPNIILIGDSTVRNGAGTGTGGQWGWGEPIADYFDKSKVNLVNRAVGGLSSRTFLTGRYWDTVTPLIKPGDIVLMQIGTNDSGAINDTLRARASLPGIGEETQAIDNMLTHQHEIVHTYGWYLRQFIEGTRAKGGTPVVCSLIPQKNWKDGKITRSRYAGWAADTAAASHVPFIDLNALIAQKYNALGQPAVEPLYADPHTHTSRAGAELNARCVVAGLKALKLAPAAYFSAKAADVAPADANFVATNAAPAK